MHDFPIGAISFRMILLFNLALTRRNRPPANSPRTPCKQGQEFC